MPRFFVSQPLTAGGSALLDAQQAAHARVLRLSAGDPVTLCDGQGTDAQCRVEEISPTQVVLSIDSVAPSVSEPHLQCSIYMGFPKADKFEHVIQKATELGAYELVVFPCARSVSRPDAKALSKKLERWQKIAAAAAEQCGRGRIPQVLVLDSFDAAAKRAAQAELPILFYENEENYSLQNAVESGSFSTAALMTGPEGGLTPEEVRCAREAGLQICSLGKRILRCETAPLCALSAVMYAAGELA